MIYLHVLDKKLSVLSFSNKGESYFTLHSWSSDCMHFFFWFPFSCLFHLHIIE